MCGCEGSLECKIAGILPAPGPLSRCSVLAIASHTDIPAGSLIFPWGGEPPLQLSRALGPGIQVMSLGKLFSWAERKAHVAFPGPLSNLLFHWLIIQGQKA